jgi:hypothetical protein
MGKPACAGSACFFICQVQHDLLEVIRASVQAKRIAPAVNRLLLLFSASGALQHRTPAGSPLMQAPSKMRYFTAHHNNAEFIHAVSSRKNRFA